MDALFHAARNDLAIQLEPMRNDKYALKVSADDTNSYIDVRLCTQAGGIQVIHEKLRDCVHSDDLSEKLAQIIDTAQKAFRSYADE
mgnify:CR=1 FL=1